MKAQEIASDAVRAVLRATNSTEAEAAIVAEIAAAEERGRRRGVEERDELRDRMHQTIAFLLSCVASGEKLSDEEEAGIRAMLREGLAPRDSAPVCWKCGAPYRDAGACGYCQAPRGSGEETT